jgi:hypothetical protein
LEPDFFITFYGEPDAENRLMREGVIRIGGFSEAFEASLVYWTEDDYLQQWQQALARLFAGYEHSCLISSIDDPKQARFLIWWPIYRVGDRVYIQNRTICCFLISLLAGLMRQIFIGMLARVRRVMSVGMRYRSGAFRCNRCACFMMHWCGLMVAILVRNDKPAH